MTANTQPATIPPLSIALLGARRSAPHALPAPPPLPALTRGASITATLHAHDVGSLTGVVVATHDAQHACHVLGVVVAVGARQWWFPATAGVLGGPAGLQELALKVSPYEPGNRCLPVLTQ